jgi:prefoldin subunit 5
MPRKKITPKEFVEQATGVRLSSHEKLCAERMKVLNESINELKKEVKSLRNDVSTGKGMVKVLVFLGTIVATVIGVIQFK